MNATEKKLAAYRDFLLGHPSAATARRLGVAPRTIRLWQSEEGWGQDRKDLYALARLVVLVDLIRDMTEDQTLGRLAETIAAEDAAAEQASGLGAARRVGKLADPVALKRLLARGVPEPAKGRAKKTPSAT